MPLGDLLFQRLRSARRDELEDIWRDLKLDPAKFSTTTDDDLPTVISKEFRAAAGHSVSNFLRDDHDLSYRKILIDAADKLAPSWRWTGFSLVGPETEEQIEDYVYERFLEKMQEQIKSMSDADRSGLQERVEADLKALRLPQKALASVSMALVAGSIAGAPIGIAAAVTYLTGTSYSKTLPATVRIIHIRRCRAAEQSLRSGE